MKSEDLKSLLSKIASLPDHVHYGTVTEILGMLIEAQGLPKDICIGSRCALLPAGKKPLMSEVVGFKQGKALLMPFGSLEGVGLGCFVEKKSLHPTIAPHASWLGRVINGLGEPIDGKGPLKEGSSAYSIHASPLKAHQRQRVKERLDLGVRALNTFLTCCKGQRMGIFAGSGVGKSVLLSMLARFTKSDINIIGLIGERGREVREFIEDTLGEEGLKRSIVVVATSDEAPLMRRAAAYLTLTLAEFFRDQEKEVLCLLDSVTRFAMAQREIGLSTGEPPASKGYTPTVFAELPKLLERAGPGSLAGNITGLFTVLVDGDDHNEPIADAVRGILDGHIVLDRKIAERGRYPAINILKSISRTMPDCNAENETVAIQKARKFLATYEDMAEMIRLGAYKKGSSPGVDEAIKYNEPLSRFLSQGKYEKYTLEEGFQELFTLLEIEK